ncbi:hypothetical protein PYCCODRAFT_1420552 [Trametes coccinea BRFM310]|uniref:Uncharacterized protein n=1 Tax=Trametes coccinea (strain BRFM310) TaxID=1353009 RepID=A0A1Y2I6L2_TRAC3|nr:hypothetical protein PYCCODRAFT_1420552 [Trametes coccinea BRFM310]
MKRSCPEPLCYAVIRIDPVAMVEHFNDPIATAEACALRPKKYLVYLDTGLDLPFPTNSWFKFLISLVATRLRPEIPAKGITSDMSIPIYPNTSHPTGRTPLYTEDPFPFANCYHWVNNMTHIRVRRRDSEFDENQAVKVTPWEHVTMNITLSEDQQRIAANLARSTLHGRSEGSTRTQTETGSPDALISSTEACDPAPTTQSSSSTQDSRTLTVLSGASDGDKVHTFIQANLLQGEHSTAELLPHAPSEYDPTVAAIFRMDVFGLGHDDGAELLPLVDLWYELTEHLTEDTIPDPLGFYQERNAIVKIIQDARARSPNMPFPCRNEDGLSLMSEEFSFEHNADFNPDDSSIPHVEIVSLVQEPVNDSTNDDVALTERFDVQAPPQLAPEGQSPPAQVSKMKMVFARVRNTFLRPWSMRSPAFLPWWP